MGKIVKNEVFLQFLGGKRWFSKNEVWKWIIFWRHFLEVFKITKNRQKWGLKVKNGGLEGAISIWVCTKTRFFTKKEIMKMRVKKEVFLGRGGDFWRFWEVGVYKNRWLQGYYGHINSWKRVKNITFGVLSFDIFLIRVFEGFFWCFWSLCGEV